MTDLQEKIIRYQMAMSMARTMLARGIITEEKYHEIDTIMAKKHDVSSCTIYRQQIRKQVDITNF